ncbi:MAG: uncharacterized protein JWN86_3708 [Planctomycetota bacterium]|nr:uncharacterized protein [Planctomycetota bacterium]
MTSTRTSRFRPELQSLEGRALLSGATASLSRGVLTITRTDASQVLQVDVQTLTVKAHGKAAPAPGGGTVIVQGVGSFAARKVKSISINPGWTTDNIIVHQPSRKAIAFRINGTSGTPPVVIPAPNTNKPPVPTGVTGAHSTLEQQIFDLINAERVKAGVPALALNAKLVTAAQIHARDMAATDLMEHDLSNVPSIAQPTLLSRAAFVGYQRGYLGENIAAFFNDATSLVAGWMASPGHKSNILNTNLTEAGVGVGVDSQGVLFFCQEFGSPPLG